MEITKADFVAIPTQDMERAIAFYVETLGLRQDEHRSAEFWAGETCLSLWSRSGRGRSSRRRQRG
jgi:catechol 2,3-dioxygenase-like lactoylglutathione lyase family enzyme